MSRLNLNVFAWLVPAIISLTAASTLQAGDFGKKVAMYREIRMQPNATSEQVTTFLTQHPDCYLEPDQHGNLFLVEKTNESYEDGVLVETFNRYTLPPAVQAYFRGYSSSSVWPL